MLAANNGAGPARGLVLDARHLGTLMRGNRALRLGFLSAGGRETHASQGNASGQLANNLGALASGILHGGRDLPVRNDYRCVPAQELQDILCDDTELMPFGIQLSYEDQDA